MWLQVLRVKGKGSDEGWMTGDGIRDEIYGYLVILREVEAIF
jgi:hypothetical protein